MDAKDMCKRERERERESRWSSDYQDRVVWARATTTVILVQAMDSVFFRLTSVPVHLALISGVRIAGHVHLGPIEWDLIVQPSVLGVRRPRPSKLDRKKIRDRPPQTHLDPEALDLELTPPVLVVPIAAPGIVTLRPDLESDLGFVLVLAFRSK
jgi:hypothetical protein